MGGGEVHQHDIRIHTLGQHTAFCAAALGLGAGDGGHHQGCGGGEGSGILRSGPGLHGGAADHFEHIQVTGFHNTVAAQRHIDAGVTYLGIMEENLTVLKEALK